MLILLLVVLVFYTGVLSPDPWRAAERQTNATYSDPFAYCEKVENIDTPGYPYVGPKVPDTVARGLRDALQVPPDRDLQPFLENSFWRCMDGRVYACTVGANLPCTAKANTSREPSEAVEKFCAANRNAPAIPLVVTGRATVYAWKCENGRPVIVRQFVKPDARGFLSNIWYQIVPEARGGGQRPEVGDQKLAE